MKQRKREKNLEKGLTKSLEMKRMKFEIQNIVAKADLGVKIDLNKLATDNADTEYEPASFPGLTLRLKNPKATFLIFGSGKIVITGCKSLKNLKDVGEKLESIVRKYKMI